MQRIKAHQSTWRAFLMDGDVDYLLARLTTFAGAAFVGRAGYFAQQACEKYAKAVSVKRTGEYWKSHKVAELLNDVTTDPRMRFIAERFDPFVEAGRYSNTELNHPDVKVVLGGEIKIGGALVWGAAYLSMLDEFVYNIRNLLIDREDANYTDQLDAVIKGDPKAILNDWACKGLPIRDVLLSHNFHFQMLAGIVPMPDNKA